MPLGPRPAEETGAKPKLLFLTRFLLSICVLSSTVSKETRRHFWWQLAALNATFACATSFERLSIRVLISGGRYSGL